MTGNSDQNRLPMSQQRQQQCEDNNVMERAAALAEDTAAYISQFTQEPSIRVGRLRSTTSCSTTPPPSLDAIVSHYAPHCLEQQFRDLYLTLQPALSSSSSSSSNNNSNKRNNTAALVQGPPGSGKSLLVQHVLTALAATAPNTNVRVVSIHCHHVSHTHLVVRDMLRQVTMIDDSASTDTTSTTTSDNRDSATTTPHWARLRQASFTNQLQLLNEILHTAAIDGVPILFVLDGLETLLGTSSTDQGDSSTTTDGRQLLLYHLLDRVASAGDKALCSVVGMTSHVGFMTKLEKRIKSRAEGTVRFVYTKPPPTYAELVEALLVLLQRPAGEGGVQQVVDDTANKESSRAAEQPMDNGGASSSTTLQDMLRSTLLQYAPWERQYRLGRPVRWFRTLLLRALLRYQQKILAVQQQAKAAVATTTDEISDDHSSKKDHTVTTTTTTLPVFNASFLTAEDGCCSASTTHTPRFNDWTGPQVALVLAARRVLLKSSCHHHAGSSSSSTPLTCRSMIREYHATFQRYSSTYLYRSFLDLLDMGIFRPAKDHVGTGPWLYHQQRLLLASMDEPEVQALPLHLTIDLQRDIQQALDANTISSCSTALREWGRRSV